MVYCELDDSLYIRAPTDEEVRKNVKNLIDILQLDLSPIK